MCANVIAISSETVIPRHPFERLSPPVLRSACTALFFAWAALTVLLLAVVPVEHVGALLRFLAAPDPGEAAGRIAAWSTEVRASVRLLVEIDFLYDVVHNNAVALLCVWGARAAVSRVATAMARVLAWTLWLDTALNVGENLAALHLVGGGDTRPWFRVVVMLTTFRFATLWLALAFGSITVAVGILRARRASAA